ncbi:hypothetical protein BM477_00270 [Boudabousia marimammalium]|uniref:Surface-anchored protein n=2 Tax=Boudabousia marimammalium TaxID=156892 RepID=A0A1Q5PSG4_9ACTO|nr:hypothetical protein BM477_00270 [Boudabousia marimammalium]
MKQLSTTQTNPRPASRWLKIAAATAAAFSFFTAGLLTGAPSASADELDQVVGENETLSHDRAEIREGHMDIGPRIIDGQWMLAVRDDSKDTPAWRLPKDVIFRVGDQSILQVPDSGAYDFTGAKAGENAYVIPQSQLPGVPWLGWNTQAPEVTKQIARGINLTFLGAQGPGNLNVFLESGNFSEPTQLWDARKSEPQPIWVDLHTHTHATWVFTKPGIYAVALNVSATGNDGKNHSSTSVFRFAVGDQASAEEAFNTQWQGEIPSAEGVKSALAGGSDAAAPVATAEPTATTPAGTMEPVTTPEVVANQPASGGLSMGALIAIIGGALVLIGGVVFFVMRRNQAAKRAAEAAVSATPAGSVETSSAPSSPASPSNHNAPSAPKRSQQNDGDSL